VVGKIGKKLRLLRGRPRIIAIEPEPRPPRIIEIRKIKKPRVIEVRRR
jgi:hypothetical protein